MVTVGFYSLLRMKMGIDEVELPWHQGDTVVDILKKADAAASAQVLHRLVDDATMRAGTIILLNRSNIHHLQGLQTPVADGDVLALFPPAAGG